MTNTTSTFFATEQNRAAIGNFAAVIRTLPLLEATTPDVSHPLQVFFSIFSENLEAFDRHCTVNIEWIGKRYIDQLIYFVDFQGEKKNELLLEIFTNSYRFLCEFEFSQPGDMSFELREIKNFVCDRLEEFEGRHRQQLVYANYVMPANVAKRLIHDSSLADFKEFASSASAAKKLKELWDKEIEEKNSEIEGLKKSIERVKTQYNFVGLVSGFEALVRQKKDESSSAFYALVILGIIMMIPVSV